MAKNALAKRITRAVHRGVVEGKATHTQMCLDAASMAANDVFHMGPKTAPLFAAAYSKYIGKIARTAIEDTPDMEYTWAKIDERLQQIYGENFQPHEVRYGG